MQGRILVPTDLSPESNSVFPWALTLAQAFPRKLYLLNVMDPDSVNKPERLEDFPKFDKFFAQDREAGFSPPLEPTVPSSKMYLYHDDVARVVVGVAKTNHADLICMAVIRPGANFAWWSAGKITETIIEKSPCSVFCARGRNLPPEKWQRPQLRNILFLTELPPGGVVPLGKVLPWVERFKARLHIFPVGNLEKPADQAALQNLHQQASANTHILMFKDPRRRTANLCRLIAETPVDLILMTPRVRVRFSNRLFSDIFVKLLSTTDVPVLFLR